MNDNNVALARLNRLAAQLMVSGDGPLSVASVSASLTPLEDERRGASFDIKLLNNILDGGPEWSDMKEFLYGIIEGDPVLRDDNRFDFTRQEAREKTMEKIAHIMKTYTSGGMGKANKPEKTEEEKKKKKEGDKESKVPGPRDKLSLTFWSLMSLYDPSWATRIGVHFGLFWGAISGQGTKEQIKKFSSDVQKGRIFGCYAMTELGHGSYIQGFETTATLDKSKDEWIINSPTETSTKWWIGMAGQTATHSVVFARLIIDGKDHGVHSFMVQIRDTATGEALPGIDVGDCGAKMGRNGLDNGYIQYHNVRIPRDDMLMRWAQVTKEGEYIKPPKAQLSYGALITGRVSILNDSANWVKKALTISLRYSAVRRQFPSAENPNVESKILDYPTHQIRLLPILAAAYAYHFTSDQLNKHYESLLLDLERGDISALAGVHATSAGLKAFGTWWCNESLEVTRQCLGGHGYSSYAGISPLLADFAVNCSWEGDNTVLAQQTAKFLIKSLRKVASGKKMNGFESYMNEARSVGSQKWPVQTIEDVLDADLQLRAFQNLVIFIATKISRIMEEEAGKGKNKQQVWSSVMAEQVLLARVHCEYYVLHCFINAIRDVEDAKVARALTNLRNLHALVTIEKYSSYLLESGYFSGAQIDFIRKQIRSMCAATRGDAIPFVDAFGFPDFILNSPLGRYDGEVYKNYFERVKAAPNATGKAPYWDKVIRPMTTAPPKVKKQQKQQQTSWSIRCTGDAEKQRLRQHNALEALLSAVCICDVSCTFERRRNVDVLPGLGTAILRTPQPRQTLACLHRRGPRKGVSTPARIKHFRVSSSVRSTRGHTVFCPKAILAGQQCVIILERRAEATCDHCRLRGSLEVAGDTFLSSLSRTCGHLERSMFGTPIVIVALRLLLACCFPKGTTKWLNPFIGALICYDVTFHILSRVVQNAKRKGVEQRTYALLRSVCRSWNEMSENITPAAKPLTSSANHFVDDDSIALASSRGAIHSVRFLLNYTNPSAWSNEAIRAACQNGRCDVVQLLLSDPRVDPSDGNNWAIQAAASRGHAGIIRLLMEDGRADPAAGGNWPIRKASQNGSIEIVRMLMRDDRVDPSSSHHWALRMAMKNGHEQVAFELMKDPRVDPRVRDDELM
ncbi:acyl-coenzyme A oxidase I [Planoprotostelium fungivorum]|uniref:acyl-CoA oxidase n=1 Tax=Planoprotostelium fungivorum TaxID=1890364 RepID=A0A2P6NXP7_9EUKA|nr:acyl-coenzyme A oxidase I [Planoprotostelium fungivorum]